MNGNINIENYEAYFLDYLEGKLSKENEEELFLFLEVQPGLKSEMEGYAELYLSPENVNYTGKDSLKQPVFSYEIIDKENIEDACIAYWEGDLTAEEKQQVKNYLKQHHERERDFSVYSKLFLTPGNHSFSGKEKLFRKLRPIAFGMAYRISAVAAVVLMILAFMFWQKAFRNPAEEKRQASIHREMIVPTIEKTGKIVPSGEHKKEKAITGEVASSVTHKNEQKKSQMANRKREKESISELKSREVIKTRKVSVSLAYCPVIYDFKIQASEINPQLAVSWHEGEEKTKENYLTLGEYISLKIKRDVIKEDTARNPRLNFRDVFLLGVKGINSLTGIDLQIKKKEDPSKGKEYFAMSSNIFSYVRERKTDRK